MVGAPYQSFGPAGACMPCVYVHVRNCLAAGSKTQHHPVSSSGWFGCSRMPDAVSDLAAHAVPECECALGLSVPRISEGARASTTEARCQNGGRTSSSKSGQGRKSTLLCVAELCKFLTYAGVW